MRLPSVGSPRRVVTMAQLAFVVPAQHLAYHLHGVRFGDEALPDDLDLSAVTIHCDAAADLGTIARWELRLWIGGAHAWRRLWATSAHHVIAELDGRRLGYAGIAERVVSFEGQPVRAGLLGGVFTDPAARHMGIGSTLCTHAHERMVELGLEFGVLTCGEDLVPFYERLGWHVVPGPMTFDWGWGPRRSDSTSMAISLRGAPLPAGAIDLCGRPA